MIKSKQKPADPAAQHKTLEKLIRVLIVDEPQHLDSGD